MAINEATAATKPKFRIFTEIPHWLIVPQIGTDFQIDFATVTVRRQKKALDQHSLAAIEKRSGVPLN
jgi:hypothetical protein